MKFDKIHLSLLILAWNLLAEVNSSSSILSQKATIDHYHYLTIDTDEMLCTLIKT